MNLLKFILKRYWGVVAIYILIIVGGIKSADYFRCEPLWFGAYIFIIGGSMLGMGKIIYNEWKVS